MRDDMNMDGWVYSKKEKKGWIYRNVEKRWVYSKNRKRMGFR